DGPAGDERLPARGAVDLDGALADDPARPAQHPDAGTGGPLDLALVVPAAGERVAAREHRLRVELGRRPGQPPQRRHRVPGPQQRLRRDAGPVRALPAEQLRLDDQRREAGADGVVGDVLPRRATAQHDDVNVRHHDTPATASSTSVVPSRSSRILPALPGWSSSPASTAAVSSRVTLPGGTGGGASSTLPTPGSSVREPGRRIVQSRWSAARIASSDAFLAAM